MHQNTNHILPAQPSPGPYEPGISVEGELCIYTSDAPGRAGGQPIAMMVRDNEEANAALLAASWGLLEASRDLLVVASRYIRPIAARQIEALEAAIEKATNVGVTT